MFNYVSDSSSLSMLDLRTLLENEVVNEIIVDDDIAKDAYIALHRMLQVT